MGHDGNTDTDYCCAEGEQILTGQKLTNNGVVFECSCRMEGPEEISTVSSDVYSDGEAFDTFDTTSGGSSRRRGSKNNRRRSGESSSENTVTSTGVSSRNYVAGL